MEVSGQYHTPAALPPGEDFGIHWIGGWVGPKVGLDILEKKKSPEPTGIQPGTVRPVA